MCWHTHEVQWPLRDTQFGLAAQPIPHVADHATATPTLEKDSLAAQGLLDDEGRGELQGSPEDGLACQGQHLDGRLQCAHSAQGAANMRERWNKLRCTVSHPTAEPTTFHNRKAHRKHSSKLSPPSMERRACIDGRGAALNA